MAQRRKIAGIAAEETEDGFVIHIVDDADEVFEIEASRENVELMVANLSAVLGHGSGEEAPAED